MGSNHEKNGGQKSRDTLPLNQLPFFCLIFCLLHQNLVDIPGGKMSRKKVRVGGRKSCSFQEGTNFLFVMNLFSARSNCSISNKTKQKNYFCHILLSLEDNRDIEEKIRKN